MEHGAQDGSNILTGYQQMDKKSRTKTTVQEARGHIQWW
jgi:hypothetical protein